jgi:hypothetical protein
LPGDVALYPKLSGATVLDYLADLRGGVDRRVRDQLAERFDAQLDRPVRELSTGNRQKLGLIVSELHGGADYGTMAGWMRSEIGAVYGPLVIAGTAIAGAVG